MTSSGACPAAKVAVLLGLAALAVPIFGGCGGDDEGAPSSTPEAASQRVDAEREVASRRVDAERSRPEASFNRLRLYERGDPIVWVKRDRRVDVRAAPDGAVVRRVGHETEFGSPTVMAVERARGRWAGVLTPHRPNGELGWVRLNARRLRAGYTTSTATVDLSERETTIRRAGEVLRRFPVTVGAADSPTPVGRFAVTDTFKGDLSPAYGCCAVAITAEQPHLPSGWMGGNRIAFHGTTGPLGVAASNGCIRAADRDVEPLLAELPLGSRVEIRG